jgi:urease accessory protein
MNAPLTPSSLLPRVRADLRLVFARAGARTEAARVYETGGWRIRFPRSVGPCEAVLVNTGGGMAGGDRARIYIEAGTDADGLVTSQSQEKIYRADGVGVAIETRLKVASGARLVFAPQETLLFDGARLQRSLDADVEETSTLTIFEAVAFGRLAHGETRIDASLSDRWRIRRGGRLVFAEALTIEDAGAMLDRPAIGGGARALATLMRVGPGAEDRRDALRAAFASVEAEPGPRFEAGVSVADGVLIARLASPSPQRLREGLFAAWRALEERDAPRVWS